MSSLEGLCKCGAFAIEGVELCSDCAWDEKDSQEVAEATGADEGLCDCGGCTDCDERAFDHWVDQQTDDQINHMHGVDD